MTRHVDLPWEKIARRLTTLELRNSSAADDAVRDERFVGVYSKEGLARALQQYGVDAKLRAKGLGDYQLDVVEDDPFRHRLEIRLATGETIMDMRLHLTRVAMRGQSDAIDVVVVDWLEMQNPRATFSESHPRLPGQHQPGTGLGREVHALLVLMCRRIQRDALVTIPGRFHLAELYRRLGYVAVDDADERFVDDVIASTQHLTFAARAWALERNCIHTEDGAPAAYQAHERVLAVSSRAERALAPGGFLSFLRTRPHARYTVDLDKLRASLRAEPVEGMDPDHLVR